MTMLKLSVKVLESLETSLMSLKEEITKLIQSFHQWFNLFMLQLEQSLKNPILIRRLSSALLLQWPILSQLAINL
jgi:hypothetical protein